MSKHTRDQELCLLMTPIVAFFDVEILQIQRSIWKADVVFAQRLTHVDDVLHFLIIQLVVNRTDSLGLTFGFWKQVLLRDVHI